MYYGTASGRARRWGKHLRFPDLYTKLFSCTSLSESNTTLGNDVIITTTPECVDSTFLLDGKMPRIHLTIYKVSSCRSTTRFSMILNHRHSWKYCMHMCTEMRPGKGTSCLVIVLTGSALKGLAGCRQFSARNKLLTRFGAASGPRKLATVCWAKKLTSTEIRTWYVDSWKNYKSARQF